MPKTALYENVDDLLTSVSQINYTISHRCSSHIHMDVSSLYALKRVAVVCLMVADEDFFYQFNTERKKNNFCVPLLYNPTFRSTLEQTIYPGRGPDLKYMSVNTMAISQHGSVEMRHFSPLMSMEQVTTIVDRMESHYEIADGMTGVRTPKQLKTYLLSNVSDRPADFQLGLEWCLDMYIQLRGER
jgi:hypothetical protein